jgi:hypothetical protein
LGERFTAVSEAGFTVRIAVFVFVPSLALTSTCVVLATAVVMIVNGAETVDPPATVTDCGTAATEGLELLKVMVAPPAGAADVRVTVFALVGWPPTTGEGESVNAERATFVREKVVEML